MRPDALTRALTWLDMSVAAAKFTLRESPAPLEDRLRWFASELERLAGEAYNLADEACQLSDEQGPASPVGRTPV